MIRWLLISSKRWVVWIIRSMILFIRRFIKDNYPRVAASLSFTSVLALVPLLTVILSVLAFVPYFEKWSKMIELLIFTHLVPASSETVQAYLHAFTEKAGELTIIGSAFVLVSSVTLLASIESAFNDIFRVQTERYWLRKLLVYFVVLIFGPLLMVASVAISSIFLSLAGIGKWTMLDTVISKLMMVSPVVFEFSMFFLFYKLIPNTQIIARAAAMGAGSALALFELAKWGFVLYLTNFDSYQVIYGALATVPIFLIWLYVSWLILLMGALLAALVNEFLKKKKEAI